MQQTSSRQSDATSADERVRALLARMTLAEKIGQMTQVEKDSIAPEDVTAYSIGSVLSGGGGNPTPNTPQVWREMVQEYIAASLQTRLSIPLLYGVDAVHGHNNVKGATIFPHNIGLGATRNPDIVQRIAQATAAEVLSTHVRWNFAPAVSVPQDIRWGRTYEGYSEDTALVTELGLAYVRGLNQPQGANETWVLESVKHYAADGGTVWDSRKDMPNTDANNWQAASENWRIDQGDARMDEATLREVHLAPYKAAIDAGARNIMVSFSSWNGRKMHAHHYLLTDVLKNEWGFDGFLVSDWMAINQISDDFRECVVTSINAGLDMIMVPYDYKQFIDTLTDAVQSGAVSRERIDDAVTRILRVKVELGLFEQPYTDEALLETVGCDAHRTIAEEAVQQSLVLLKHENAALPLQASQTIGVAGHAADDIGLACGGWTIDWQGGTGAITAGTTLLDGLQAALADAVTYDASGDFDNAVDTAVVVVAEQPYAEGEGDKADLTLSADDIALIEKVRSQCEKLVLVIYSGRPVVISDVLDHCDAIIAAWLPGSEAAAIAANLLGEVPFTGKLPYTWVRSMEQLPLGHLQANKLEALWERGHGLSL